MDRKSALRTIQIPTKHGYPYQLLYYGYIYVCWIDLGVVWCHVSVTGHQKMWSLREVVCGSWSDPWSPRWIISSVYVPMHHHIFDIKSRYKKYSNGRVRTCQSMLGPPQSQLPLDPWVESEPLLPPWSDLTQEMASIHSSHLLKCTGHGCP